MKKQPFTPRKAEKALTTYSAAAGALLAANHAGAAIIHTDLEGMQLFSLDEFTLNFDLPGGTYGVTLGVGSDVSFVGATSRWIYSAFVTGAGERAVDGVGRPMVLSFGQNIRTAPAAAGGGFGGGTLLGEQVFSYWSSLSSYYVTTGSGAGYTTFFSTFGSSTTTTGNFIGQNNVYLGLKVTDSGTDYFGWAEISVDEFAGNLTLHSWAYDDEGNDITTGQVIPEPAHIGLLAAGAAGVLAWRRKRRQIAEEAGSERESA